MAKATTTRGRKMSTETEMEVEDPYRNKVSHRQSHVYGEQPWGSIGEHELLIRNQKHPLSGKQILNFAHPEQNTKVRKNKHKHK